jgi:hypothetical protein
MARYAGLSSQGQAQFDPARMPPQGQPMAQGREGLAQALMQQQAPAPGQQAIEQAAPQQVDPRAQFNSPQLNAADPTRGILQAIMGQQGGQQSQANPAAAKVQQAMQGQSSGTNLDMNKAIELMNNPFLDPGKKQVLGAMLERQMQAQDPVRQMQLEKGRLELEQMRNPQPKITDKMREYELSKSQGFQGSYLDYQTAIEKARATNVTTNVNGEPSDGALRKKLDEKTGELWSTYSEQGANSAALAQDMEILDELIKVAPQGPITGRLAQMFPGVSSAGDAFQSIVKRVAPTLRAPGSGSTSDIEYDGMLKSLPALSNLPEANVLIGQVMKSKAAINIERGKIVSDYSQGIITAGEAKSRMAEIDKRSIMTPEMKDALSGVSQSANKPDGWQEVVPGVRVRRMD